MLMKEYTVTISAVDKQERNMRVRELLKRGYMPLKFYKKDCSRNEHQEANYKDSFGGTHREMQEKSWTVYCVVLKKKVWEPAKG